MRSRYSYDAVNLRTRRIEEVEFNETRDFFDTLHLHNVVSLQIHCPHSTFLNGQFLVFQIYQYPSVIRASIRQTFEH